MKKKQRLSASSGRKRATTIFRHLGTELPQDCTPDWNWQVEVHEGRGFPIGLAWVIAPPPGMTEPPPGWSLTPSLKFVLVIDDARRQGIGTRLVEACRERWPDIDLGAPISRAGAALHRKCSSPDSLDVFNSEFIQKQLAAGVPPTELERIFAEHRSAVYSQARSASRHNGELQDAKRDSLGAPRARETKKDRKRSTRRGR